MTKPAATVTAEPPPSKASLGIVDRSKPFYPAEHTALYFTPAWSDLSAAHRLRYTQLYGLYVNEQTAFFEESLAQTVLPALYNNNGPTRIHTKLVANLREFEADERRHTRWFRELNHQIDPGHFSLKSKTYRFIQIPAWQTKLSEALSKRPWLLPCWIWIMLIQEERSIFISQACINSSVPIEPNFVALHRKHLADEVHHVRWDSDLLQVLWEKRSKTIRVVNARLFQLMMAEFFTAPKRAARAVVNQLVAEFSDLAPLHDTLLNQLAALKDCRDYHASLYDREKTPRTFAFFDASPEFSKLDRTLLAYDRKPVS